MRLGSKLSSSESLRPWDQPRHPCSTSPYTLSTCSQR